jgi:hypothetical protein
MKEFEPSAGFVSRVMDAVFDHEREFARGEATRGLARGYRLLDQFRYVMSSCGVVFGVLLVPATCM